MTQTPKEHLFTELFNRRPVEPLLIRQVLGAFEKEVVDLAFYWMGLGNRTGYTAIITEVLKGVPDLAEKVLIQVPKYGTWGDLWELYGTSEAGDKIIDSVVLGQFLEDQESEKPSQFVKFLPIDLKNPLSKRFSRLFFYLTKDSQRRRRYRKAVSCLKRFCAAEAEAVPERRIFSEGESGVADTFLYNILHPSELKHDVECITNVKISDDILFMCDYSESMCGKPLDISLALGILSGRIMSFEKKPRWHIFREEDSIQKKIRSTLSIAQASQADFNIVYDVILKEIICGKIAVPKQLILVTDMDYKDVCSCVFDVKGVRERFIKEGYEAPLLVIWNVSRSFGGPRAVLYEEGVAQMYGWSDSMWKMLVGGMTIITPMELVQAYSFKQNVIDV
jgi:hypothetical protein